MLKVAELNSLHVYTFSLYIYKLFNAPIQMQLQLILNKSKLSRDMRFPTMWYVQPAKAQTSLLIRPA